MERPDQKRLFTCAAPVKTAVASLDLDRLRVIFRDLFDDADSKLQREGFDHDEIEIRRFLLCRRQDGTTLRINTDSLADRKTLLEQLQREVIGSGDLADGENVLTDGTIVQAEIDVVRDDWKWYGG